MTKSVLAEFRDIQKAQPALGDYPALAHAVSVSGKLTKEEIEQWFDKLVAKDQYPRGQRVELIYYLFNISRIHSKQVPIGFGA